MVRQRERFHSGAAGQSCVGVWGQGESHSPCVWHMFQTNINYVTLYSSTESVSWLSLLSWKVRRRTWISTTTACPTYRLWAQTTWAWTAAWPATTKTQRMRAGLTPTTSWTRHWTSHSRCRPSVDHQSPYCQMRWERPLILHSVHVDLLSYWCLFNPTLPTLLCVYVCVCVCVYVCVEASPWTPGSYEEVREQRGVEQRAQPSPLVCPWAPEGEILPLLPPHEHRSIAGDVILTETHPTAEQSFQMVRYVTHNPLLWQVRAQTRTDSTRSYDSHSSSTISSDAAGGNRPPPPPVALKPSLNRLNQSSEEQSPGKEEPDPANKSFLGKVSVIIISLSGAVIDEQSSSCSGLLNLMFPL